MKRQTLAAVMVLVFLLLAGCGGGSGKTPAAGGGASAPGSAPAAPKGPMVLTVGTTADVVTLDPPMLTDVYSGAVTRQIHEPLFTVDQSGKVVPLLAEKLEQPDNKTYVISLRKGVKFHNGDELTSADVKFTFERVLDKNTKSPRANQLEPIASIETPDNYTVKITLNAPFAPFVDRLTGTYAAVLNARHTKEKGADYAKAPVGTGPFKYVEWKTGDRAVVERFDGYWGAKPKLDKVIFRPIPDHNARLVELESGGIDIMTDIPPEEVERVKKEGKLQVFVDPSVNYTYVAFHTGKPPFNNKKLRQAVAYAIDGDEIVKAILNNVHEPAISPLSARNWAHNPNVPKYKFDPARAKQLLAESGFDVKQPVEYVTSESPTNKRVAERVQAQLKEVLGMDVKVKILEWGGFLNYIRTGEHQIFSLGWSGGADPDSIVFALFHSKNFGAAGNRAFFKSERADKLIDEGQTTLEQEKRKKIYEELQTVLLEEAPHKPMYHTAITTGAKKSVKGYKNHPLGSAWMTFFDVTVEGK